jgi:polyhydroxyalkanoate synthesis regulator phasin
MAERRGTSSKSGGGARSAAARKGGQARGRQQRARKQAGRAASAATKPAQTAGVSAKSAAELGDALRQNLIRPFDMMLITRERIEQVLGEAVERGQVTVDGAQGIASRLVERGRKQTNDVLKDLEQVLNKGRDEIEGRTSDARRRATRAASPALAQADRIRRAARVGPSFPITSYDDLTVAQVQARLGDLTAAELRKVRDYERRNANRKTVLSTIETKLG